MFASLLIWNVTLATILAVVVWIAGTKKYLRARPALKHWLWLIVLCKLVTPPLLPLPVLSRSNQIASVHPLQDVEETDLAELDASATYRSSGLQNSSPRIVIGGERDDDTATRAGVT